MRSVTYVWLVMGAAAAWAQSVELSGIIAGPDHRSLPDVKVELRDHRTGVRREALTNVNGLYNFASLKPGTYQVTIQAPGFRTITRQSVILHVGDQASLDANLELLPAQISIRVESDIPLVNSDSASVGTLVDQKFVENMPLNGRSFQSLIFLTPGNVTMRSYQESPGQFSVNGQRTNANYFTVDGVSSNFGTTASVLLGHTYAGTVPALTMLGGTNGLVSVDAMQELRVQASSFSPEYGRTPGAQISIVTRSGSNEFHGSAFYYLRNERFDARNWFNTEPLPKAPLRQNQFGGTVGGPIRRDKTFFYASYEGLRLRQPQTQVLVLLTKEARLKAAPVYQSFLSAFPLPNGPMSAGGITASYTYAHSNPARFDATSLRLDHRFGARTSLFVRYGQTPSNQAAEQLISREGYFNDTNTLTGSAVSTFNGTATNDFRANWSRAVSWVEISDIAVPGRNVPGSSLLFPPHLKPDNGQVCLLLQFSAESLCRGSRAKNALEQINLVDVFSKSAGLHQLKAGIDFRRLAPASRSSTSFGAGVLNFDQLVAGTFGIYTGVHSAGVAARVDNYSLFGQDSWKLTPRLTVTAGLRWEVNLPPSRTGSAGALYGLNGVFDDGAFAFEPRPLWQTRYNNFAPRFGAAWWLTSETVVRVGVGTFYDLGYATGANWAVDLPYTRRIAITSPIGIPFDLNDPLFRPIAPSTNIGPSDTLSAVDPRLRVPMTYQWNLAVERRFGKNQALSLTYVGAFGINLLRADLVLPSTGNRVGVIRNADSSRYRGLQLQFQRRMLKGLQILASYSLAESEDTGSSDVGQGSQASYVVSVAPSVNQLRLPPMRPSDFDIRHSFSAAVSWASPSLKSIVSSPLAVILSNWLLDGTFRANSALPLNVMYQRLIPNSYYNQQPDVVPGKAFWASDANTPGGRRLNPAAFAVPPLDGGNFPSNSLRAFGQTQLDAALSRRFRGNERLSFEVRAEFFNALNHPMFGPPLNLWGVGGNAPRSIFGLVTQTLNSARGGGGLNGGQAAIYAPGGPRSGQFSIKLLF